MVHASDQDPDQDKLIVPVTIRSEIQKHDREARSFDHSVNITLFRSKPYYLTVNVEIRGCKLELIVDTASVYTWAHNSGKSSFGFHARHG